MRKLLCCATMLAGLAGASAAQASIVIDQAGWTGAGCVGLTSCVVSGVTIKALGNATQAAEIGTVYQNPATLSTSTVSGETGLGIDFVGYTWPANIQLRDREIQYSETMRFEFGGPVMLEELELLFLYSPPNVAGDPQEIALITGDKNGTPTTWTLQVLDDTTFTWSGDGTVTRGPLGPGLWTLNNPFSGPITYLELTAPKDPANGVDRSDYSFKSLRAVTVPVPEPASLALLGAGLVGLGLAARRRRAA